MDKGQLIEQIRQINKQAEEAFLAKFTVDELVQYLDRLKSIHQRNISLTRPLRRKSVAPSPRPAIRKAS